MFGSLRQSIFANKSLSVEARRCVYLSTVVATLLYGSETWAVKADQMRRLEVFHNRRVKSLCEWHFGGFSTSALERSHLH